MAWTQQLTATPTPSSLPGSVDKMEGQKRSNAAAAGPHPLHADGESDHFGKP